MPMVVRLYPLIAPLADAKRFAAELVRRREETDDLYQRCGVSHESWHVQELPMGAWVMCCSEMSDPAKTSAYLASADDPFASWFKRQVRTLSGVDPT